MRCSGTLFLSVDIGVEHEGTMCSVVIGEVDKVLNYLTNQQFHRTTDNLSGHQDLDANSQQS